MDEEDETNQNRVGKFNSNLKKQKEILNLEKLRVAPGLRKFAHILKERALVEKENKKSVCYEANVGFPFDVGKPLSLSLSLSVLNVKI